MYSLRIIFCHTFLCVTIFKSVSGVSWRGNRRSCSLESGKQALGCFCNLNDAKCADANSICKGHRCVCTSSSTRIGGKCVANPAACTLTSSLAHACFYCLQDGDIIQDDPKYAPRTADTLAVPTISSPQMKLTPSSACVGPFTFSVAATYSADVVAASVYETAGQTFAQNLATGLAEMPSLIYVDNSVAAPFPVRLLDQLCYYRYITAFGDHVCYDITLTDAVGARATTSVCLTVTDTYYCQLEANERNGVDDDEAGDPKNPNCGSNYNPDALRGMRMPPNPRGM